MKLETIYKNTDYTTAPSDIKEILNEVSLFDFHRTRNGKRQSFYFHFTYKNKRYVMNHSFIYEWKGVNNWFRFKGALFFRNPLKLKKSQLIELSAQFMKSVNTWNQIAN